MRLYHYLLTVTVAALPLYLVRLRIAEIPTNVFEILVAATVLVGLATLSVRRQWRTAEQHLPQAIIYLVGIFILSVLLSAIISDVPRVSFGIFKSWIIVPLLLGWLVYAESLLTTNYLPAGQAGSLLTKQALIVSGTLVALISLTYFEWGQRLTGIYDVPNSLALYLTPLIVLATGYATAALPLNKPSLGAATIMFFTLLLTQSAGGIFSVLLGLAVVLTVNNKNTIIKGLVLLGLCSTGLVFLFSQPASLAVRQQLWRISWDLVQENPILGVGLGQFEPAYQRKLHERFADYQLLTTNYSLPTPLPEFVFRDPHNWPLSFWLNTGLLGLLSFASLHIWLLWKIRHLLTTYYLLLTTALALLTLLLFGLVDTIYWKNDLSTLHWVLLALLLGSYRRGAGEKLKTGS